MQDSQLRGTAKVVSNGGIAMLVELVGLMVLYQIVIFEKNQERISNPLRSIDCPMGSC